MFWRFGPLRASSPAMLRPALLLVSCITLVMTACSGQPASAPPASAPPAQSGPTPDEPAAAEPAEPVEPKESEHDDGGFADPKVAEQTAKPEVPAAMKDPALVARVKRQFGDRCRPERTCGTMLGVDCDAAVDGPYYYVEQTDLKVVSRCGGACMNGGCTDCPPKAWACATY